MTLRHGSGLLAGVTGNARRGQYMGYRVFKRDSGVEEFMYHFSAHG